MDAARPPIAPAVTLARGVRARGLQLNGSAIWGIAGATALRARAMALGGIFVDCGVPTLMILSWLPSLRQTRPRYRSTLPADSCTAKRSRRDRPRAVRAVQVDGDRGDGGLQCQQLSHVPAGHLPALHAGQLRAFPGRARAAHVLPVGGAQALQEAVAVTPLLHPAHADSRRAHPLQRVPCLPQLRPSAAAGRAATPRQNRAGARRSCRCGLAGSSYEYVAARGAPVLVPEAQPRGRQALPGCVGAGERGCAVHAPLGGHAARRRARRLRRPAARHVGHVPAQWALELRGGECGGQAHGRVHPTAA
eukprot:scaffold831_cov336-Prasinococcus_capsulatus_cf.AAC.6